MARHTKVEHIVVNLTEYNTMYVNTTNTILK